MAVIFMFVFILSMTIFAFWGNGTEDAGDRAVRIGAVPAGQLVAFHAAVTRACAAQPANCPANSYIYKAIAGPFLSPPYDPTALPFRDGDYRLSSWFDGTTVYTYYSGIQDKETTAKPRDALIRASVTTWLNENLPQHALGNVGTYNAASRQFVARNYSSSTTYNGSTTTVSNPNGTSYVYMNGYIPDGAPIMRSKIKGEYNSP